MKELPLFVYGTLMHDQPAFTLFAAVSLRYERAHLPAMQLHTVGRYPIAVVGPNILHGELHWVSTTDYAALLKQLDAYEGDEYVRIRCQAVVDTGPDRGAEITAWVYVGDPTAAAQYPLIPSGDWRKRGDHVID